MTDTERKLFEDHYEHALKVATKHAFRYGIDVDEATNIAIDRLMKCVSRGDKCETSGAPFSGYVEKSIRLDILHVKTKAKSINFGENIELTEEKKEFAILESMPELSLIFDYKHRQVFEARHAGITFQKIGDSFGVGKKRVQQIMQKKKNFLAIVLNFLT